MSEDPSVAIDESYLADVNTSEVVRLQNELEERQRRMSEVLKERDGLRDRVEALENTLRLYQRTSGYLPVVGVTCDAPDCISAIGVVGVTMASADAISDNAVDIANAIGWHTVDSVDGFAPERHLCPKCKPR